MSDTIRQLEEALGIRLFDRTTRSVELTKAGEEFLADASQVMRTLDASVMRMGELGSAERGLVRVSGVASIHAHVTATCVASLMVSNPGIRFTLIEDEISGIVSSVLEGRSDFGFGVVPNEFADKLETTPLLVDLYGVIARKDHEAFEAKRLRLEAVAPWNYIGVSLGSEMDQHLSRLSLTSRVEVNGFSSMIALLEQGAGVGVLPALAASRMLTSKLKFRAFSGPAYERHVSLISRPGRSLSPAAQLLWNEMRRTAGSLGSTMD